MFKLATAQVWVHDQDAAVEWYTKVLGLEVREDVTLEEMEGFRWVTVASPDQDVSICLMIVPGPPVFDEETKAMIEGLAARGAAGGLFFVTDDVQARYDELLAQGVEFTQPPTEMPYGIDCGFRDPSGNHFRLTQLAPSWAS